MINVGSIVRINHNKQTGRVIYTMRFPTGLRYCVQVDDGFKWHLPAEDITLIKQGKPPKKIVDKQMDLGI
jgi:hypothetical protein